MYHNAIKDCLHNLSMGENNNSYADNIPLMNYYHGLIVGLVAALRYKGENYQDCITLIHDNLPDDCIPLENINDNNYQSIIWDISQWDNIRLNQAKYAYNYGLNNGYCIADTNITYLYCTECNNEDDFISEMLDVETNHFRQYTPFEFYAAEFNQSNDPDFTWQAYDRGVYRGIVNKLKEHKGE